MVFGIVAGAPLLREELCALLTTHSQPRAHASS